MNDQNAVLFLPIFDDSSSSSSEESDDNDDGDNELIMHVWKGEISQESGHI